MTALLSIAGLLAMATVLAGLEHLPWPPQRDSAIHDVQYWTTVQRDTAAYLATHTNASDTVRSTVAAMGQAAQQKLGRLAR